MNSTINFSNTQENENVIVKSFLTKVFTWMGAALVISGVMAYLFGVSPELQSMLSQRLENGRLTMTGLGWIVTFLPLVFILVMNFGLQRISLPVLLLVFILFAATMGMSLSTILLTYSGALVVKTFFISAATFGFMAFLGATTKTDLTRMGSYLYMGLFGIIIGSVINMFMGGAGSWIIDMLGVIVFTGLTSFQVQMLKNLALQIPAGTDQTQRFALSGALSLYMVFLNLFLSLLSLSGDRR
jgi:FtsH-binding integral membrane protein